MEPPSLVFAEALGRCVRQTGQTIDLDASLVRAETIRRCVRQARQAVEKEPALLLSEAPGILCNYIRRDHELPGLSVPATA